MTAQQIFIRSSQGVLIMFGFALLFYNPEFLPTYYRPRLMGIVALVYSFCIQLPVLVFPVPSRSANASSLKQQLFFRERLQAALSLGFLLGGLGSLGLWGLYRIGIPYDKFIHFIFPILLIVPGFSLLRAYYGWQGKKTLIFLIHTALAIAVAWEFIEYSSARWLQFGFFGQLFDRDSSRDILSTLLGAGIASVFLVRRKRSDRTLEAVNMS